MYYDTLETEVIWFCMISSMVAIYAFSIGHYNEGISSALVTVIVFSVTKIVKYNMPIKKDDEIRGE